MSETSSGLVISYHAMATEAGMNVLRAGGNAFDAFIAATMTEYIIAEGATSMAGPLGVLLYDAAKQEVKYLDAEFNQALDPAGRWTHKDGKKKLGKAMLVPGAIAGLELLSNTYGKMSFADVLQPAIRTASEGFLLNEFYEYVLHIRAKVLKSSEYGSRTFYPSEPLRAGSRLCQPEVAAFLTKLAAQGTSYMYRGDWARAFVDVVRAKGGLLTLDDLSRYEAVLRDPWKISYRGFDVYTCSGRTFGGLWSLLVLKALENAQLEQLGHFSVSETALEAVVRTAREVSAEPWLYDYRVLDNPAVIESKLDAQYASGIWARVTAAMNTEQHDRPGSHSYHMVVIDAEGNAASGTNTHESLAFGDGIFVEGVPLPASGYLELDTQPGERRMSPFSMHIGFRHDSLEFATGTFSSSILESSLQLLINLMDYRMSAEQAVDAPRFGTWPHNPEDLLSSRSRKAAKSSGKVIDYRRNYLDLRISAEIVGALEAKGLRFMPDAKQRRRGYAKTWKDKLFSLFRSEKYIETGMGAVAAKKDGIWSGAIIPSPGVTSTFTAAAAQSATLPR